MESNFTTVRIDFATKGMLSDYCKETQLKKTTVVRNAVEEYLENRSFKEKSAS